MYIMSFVIADNWLRFISASVYTGEEGSVSAIKYMRQLVSYKNFRWFVVMNLIQVSLGVMY